MQLLLAKALSLSKKIHTTYGLCKVIVLMIFIVSLIFLTVPFNFDVSIFNVGITQAWDYSYSGKETYFNLNIPGVQVTFAGQAYGNNTKTQNLSTVRMSGADSAYITGIDSEYTELLNTHAIVIEVTPEVFAIFIDDYPAHYEGDNIFSLATMSFHEKDSVNIAAYDLNDELLETVGYHLFTKKCISVDQGEVKYGDVNLNGRVEVNDAILVLRHIVGLDRLSSVQLKRAAVNGKGSGEITVQDAILILRYIVGLINELPYPKGSA